MSKGIIIEQWACLLVFILLLITSFSVKVHTQAYSNICCKKKSYTQAFINCDCCCFENADYVLYNVGGATAARIVSCEDNTKIWVNNESSEAGTIARDGVLELSLSQGDTIYACKPIFASGEWDSSNRAIVPDYTANNALGATVFRYGGVRFEIYSVDATSADIYRNGVLQTTIPLSQGDVTTFTRTGNYTGNWKIVADGQIMGFKSDDNVNGDASVMLKPHDDLLGYASTRANIAKENANATPTAFEVYSHLGNYTTGIITTTYNTVNSADLPHTNAQDNYYQDEVNIRVQANENLYGNSVADSDGGDDTPLVPIDLLRTHHKIPQPSEYVSISNINGSDIDVLDASGALVVTLTPTKVNTDPLAPYAVRFGTPNGTANVPLGYEFVSSEPIYVVYQPKDSGAFGSDDDETISYGYNKN